MLWICHGCTASSLPTSDIPISQTFSGDGSLGSETPPRDSSSTLGGEQIDYVRASELRSFDFKIVSPQITLQILEGVSFPLIDYILPSNSDYVEILRCHRGLQLRDVAGRTLSEVLQLSSDEGAMAMIGGHFWQQAMDSKNCVMVGFDYSSHSVFIDTTAKTGKFFYVARACVRSQRISPIERPLVGLSACSPFVSQTTVFDYVNDQEVGDFQHMMELTQVGLEIEGALIAIEKYAVATVEALNQCDVSEADRQRRVQKKQAMNHLIGAVGGIIAEFALPGGSQITPAKGLWGKMKNVGKRLSGAAYLSTGFTSILNDLTSSVDDFPKSCYEGDRLHQSVAVKAQDLLRLQTQYSRLVVEVRP